MRKAHCLLTFAVLLLLSFTVEASKSGFSSKDEIRIAWYAISQQEELRTTQSQLIPLILKSQKVEKSEFADILTSSGGKFRVLYLGQYGMAVAVEKASETLIYIPIAF